MKRAGTSTRSASRRGPRGLDRQTLDYSALPTGASTGRIPLVQNVPVGQFSGLVAALRVHAATVPAGAAVRIDVVAVGPTGEDPAQDFIGPIVASFEVLSTTTAPSLWVSPVGARLGTHVSIYATGTRGATAGTLSAMVSLSFRAIEGGQAWTPASLGSKLKLWLDERDQVIVSGAISDWGDQSSGGANDFQQSASGSRPTRVQANQLGAASFDGTDDRLYSTTSQPISAIIAASAYHVFAVVRFTALTLNNPFAYQNHTVLGDSPSAFWALTAKVGGVQGYHWDGAYKATNVIPVSTGVDLLVEWGFDGSAIRCRVGAGATESVAAGNVSTLTGVQNLGLAITGTWLNGVIESVLVCDQYLAPAEADVVRGYLSSKYGVPA